MQADQLYGHGMAWAEVDWWFSNLSAGGLRQSGGRWRVGGLRSRPFEDTEAADGSLLPVASDA
jgi:hypothetical protein